MENANKVLSNKVIKVVAIILICVAILCLINTCFFKIQKKLDNFEHAKNLAVEMAEEYVGEFCSVKNVGYDFANKYYLVEVVNESDTCALTYQVFIDNKSEYSYAKKVVEKRGSRFK